MIDISQQASSVIEYVEQSIMAIVHFVIGLFHAAGDLFLIITVFVLGVLFFRLLFHFIGALFIISFFVMFIGIALAITGH